MIENDAWIDNNVACNIEDINPASVDVHLGNQVICRPEEVDDYPEEGTDNIYDDGEEITLYPNAQYLLCTKEYTTCPPTHAWLFTLKSSLARRGLFLSHPGWGDPGFEGQVTFSIHVMFPVKIIIGDKIGQLIYMKMREIPKVDYTITGKYNRSTGVTKEIPDHDHMGEGCQCDEALPDPERDPEDPNA